MDQQKTKLPWVEEVARTFPYYDFETFFSAVIHDLIAQHGQLVRDYVQALPPIAFRTTAGSAYTLRADGQGVQVSLGEGDAPAVVELSERTFSDHINQLLSAVGSVQTGRARIIRGNLSDWKYWEPAIRSLVDGKPIYTPDVKNELVDSNGAPLDYTKAFLPNESFSEMKNFFQKMGYLHVKGVFSQEEILGLRKEVENCMEQSVPGDPFSWWSIDSSGNELVTRINHCERFSTKILDLAHDERLKRYARLAGAHYRVCDDRLDGPMVFIKHPNVVKGNGDLWWHIDDGIGGTPVMNPLIQAGIQLDVASAENGQVLMMAGSHRYNKRSVEWGDECDLPVVALNTEPGDLTLHFGDTMHSTPAPTSENANRRVLYYKFAEPKTFSWVPAHCHYNDALFALNEQGDASTRAAY